ncbi:hypothetical protein RJ640_005667 [Escallonia rubra]|uniref:Uncharacterized protein n=1 Tax=Escallonia rubra TaxID=112253 RepID=A0AA88RSU0_9ASTE|nr:hypothetical protein RJ640_005667 [Escallonia rubra]
MEVLVAKHEKMSRYTKREMEMISKSPVNVFEAAARSRANPLIKKGMQCGGEFKVSDGRRPLRKHQIALSRKRFVVEESSSSEGEERKGENEENQARSSQAGTPTSLKKTSDEEEGEEDDYRPPSLTRSVKASKQRRVIQFVPTSHGKEDSEKIWGASEERNFQRMNRNMKKKKNKSEWKHEDENGDEIKVEEEDEDDVNDYATSIVDLHRSFPECSYELCLSCCREIRKGFRYSDRGYDYIHGGDPLPESLYTQTSLDQIEPPTEWVAEDDGSIVCAPKSMGGCGNCVLELKFIFPKDWILSLEARAENILKISGLVQIGSKAVSPANKGKMLRRAAAREGSRDNSLYCPAAEEQHLCFRSHWAKGKLEIVRDVLKQTTGLSWEPMVMWRALCENVDFNISSKMSEVKAIDCLAGCEVEISTRKFFKSSTEGRRYANF